jgi:hypothetical protein
MGGDQKEIFLGVATNDFNLVGFIFQLGLT